MPEHFSPEAIIRSLWPVLAAMVVITFILFLTARCSRRVFGYDKRIPFLSAAERSFFEILQLAKPANTLIAIKVRLADVIKPARTTGRGNWQRAFNGTSAKHLDFVLLSSVTLEVMAAVELDDRSHEQENRRVRDQLINAALESAGIPIVRVPARASYAIDEMRKLLSGAACSNSAAARNSALPHA